MREGWQWRAARSLTLLAALLPMPGVMRAQDDPGAAGASAFAGGQMVRGTVTSVGADRVEVKTETGETYRVVVTTNTRVMKERQPLKFGDIKPGDGLGAMGVMDAPNKTVHAAVVFVVDAEQVRKAAADLGKTYITGRVEAMDELKLTIRRPDGVNQVIRVDEDTSFRRRRRGMGGARGGAGAGEGPGAVGGGAAGAGVARADAESITLADVKVGDMVFGKGALKDGVFVPTELGVMEPGARGRRRAGETAGGGDGAAAPTVGGGSPQ